MNETIKREQMVRDLAVASGMSLRAVDQFLGYLSDYIVDQCRQCNWVKVAPGLKIGGRQVEAGERYNLKTGEKEFAKGYIRGKVEFSDTFRARLNDRGGVGFKKKERGTVTRSSQLRMLDKKKKEKKQDVYDASVFKRVDTLVNDVYSEE